MISLKKIYYFQIMLFVIGTLGHPVTDPEPSDDDNCIQMTADNVEKINHLVEEISSFINKISTKYDDIDLRLVEIAVDKHSLDENKKNTTVNVTIGDCLDGNIRTEYREQPDDSIYDTDDDDINVNKPDTDISTSTPKGSDEYDTNESDEDDSNSNEINDEEINNKDADSSTEDPKEFSDTYDNFDTLNDSEHFNDKEDNLIKNDETDETEELPDDNYSKLIEPIGANDGDISNNDETIKETQNVDSNQENDTVTVSFINFNDNKNKTCHETLLLSGEDKVVFKEIEKLRGSKPFFLYQRFFNGTSQFWFL